METDKTGQVEQKNAIVPLTVATDLYDTSVLQFVLSRGSS
jgi:hypothetical protein